MNKYKIYIIIVFSCLLTGCYNYREINNIAITSAVAIDKIDDEFEITVQVINTKKSGNNSSTNSTIPTVTYTSKGKTMQEVLRKIVTSSPKRLYVSHLEILVIGEEYAKGGIKDMLDFLFRDAEVRKQFLVVVAKNSKAKDILECLTPLDNISAQNIRNTIETDNEFLGTSKVITFEEVISDYLNKRKELVIPTVEILNNTNDKDKIENIEQIDTTSKTKLSGLALFKEDKLINTLSLEESIYYNFINDNLENTIINYKCDQNNYMSIEIINSNTKIKNKKNTLEISISINGNGDISEINCPKYNLEDPKIIKELEDKINKKIKEKIKENIKLITEDYKIDSYGFEETIYKTNNKFYKTINKEKLLSSLKYNITSNIKLIEKGNTLKGVNHEKSN